MGSIDVAKYPWVSTVNVANFVTVRPWLTVEEGLTDFNIWKEQMLCLLESQGLVGFINGEIGEPQSSDEEQEKARRRGDKLVKGWILGSIGKDAVDSVWKLGTAREVWLELDKIFNPKLEAQNLDQIFDHKPETHEIQSRSEGRDLSWYSPLYKAALRGDWEKAKASFFDKDKESITAIISFDKETALHLAISNGKANDFVKRLVELMPRDALALQDKQGDTALHCAAMVGNTEAARILVNKNSDLLYILSNYDRLPVQQAAVDGHKDTLVYLLSVLRTNLMQCTPFEGQLGWRLLCAIIYSEFFDVALDLVEKYPDLARLEFGGECAMTSIATMNYVFSSGESFSWWQKWIYHRIPIKQSKREAAQTTNVAGDIENTNCDPASVYNCNRLFQIICGVGHKLEDVIWEVIEHLVPQVKGIRNKKAMHQQAIELVKYLCHQMLSLPEKDALRMLSNSIIFAAKRGIHEILEVIIEIYPQAISNSFGGESIRLAVTNRYEKVCNLIYNTSDRRILFSNAVDNENNNLMHMCAKLAPPDRLNLVPGAALQMQRELQWFKEMEMYVSPSRRKWENDNNKTPQMIFTEQHQYLKAEGEKWMKDTANACSIAAALIATVVFAAAFTVPGGVQPESGVPLFWDQFAFLLFAISDAVSLFTSITSILMFVSILTSRYAEQDFLYVLPKRLSIGLLSLFISITFMMAAFSATLYLVFRKQVSWFLIPVAAFACLPVMSFVLLQFPLLIAVVYSTYGPGIFGKKSHHLMD